MIFKKKKRSKKRKRDQDAYHYALLNEAANRGSKQ